MSPSAGTVLVVDDSEVACEVAKHTLGAAGFEVIALNSPFGFIKTIREHDPALILVDVGLGILNGGKLVNLGREYAGSRCAILLYSGREAAQLKEDVRTSGADGFIQKSTTGKDLVLAVQRWLRHAKHSG
jgi:DNA-binding response OmpR family regulator